jgi:radical SAM-linked protein
VRDKVRIRFRKDQALRWLSHHDLMRTVERMLRRAGLPFSCSKGFNPRPRLVFALSLPLGVVGCQEVLELELNQVLPLEEIRDRLFCQAPPGLTFLSVQRVTPRTQAQVRRLTYRLSVPDDRLPGLAERIAVTLADPDLLVQRKRPTERWVNVRPFLANLRLVSSEPGPNGSPLTTHHSPLTTLEICLWLLREGTARPEEVLTLLALGDLVAAGVVLERTQLELHDEVAPPPHQDKPPVPQGGPAPLPYFEKDKHEERDAD